MAEDIVASQDTAGATAAIAPSTVPVPRYDPDEPVRLGTRTVRKHRYMWFLMSIVCASFLLVSLDNTITGAASPVLVKDFHISASTVLYVASLTGAAGLLASLASGLLMDRYGRKKIYSASLVGMGVFSGFIAAITAFWQFAALRCLATTTGSAINGAQTVLVAEEASPRLRSRLQALAWIFLALGGVIGGGVAAPLLHGDHWRPLFLIAFGPTLLVLFTTRYLRESPRFARPADGGTSAEQAPAGQVSQESATELELRTPADGAGSQAPATGAQEETAPARGVFDGVRQVFGPGRRVQSAALMLFALLTGSSGVFVTYVAPLYLTDVRGFTASRAAAIVSAMSASTLLGIWPAGWLADRISPKYLMVAWEGIGSVLLVPLLLVPHGTWPVYPAVVGMGLFARGGLFILSIYLPGAFPTAVRGTATGLVLMCLDIGQILIPLASAALIGLHRTPAAIPALMVAMPVLATFCAAALRVMRPGADVDLLAAEVAGRSGETPE